MNLFTLCFIKKGRLTYDSKSCLDFNHTCLLLLYTIYFLGKKIKIRKKVFLFYTFFTVKTV